MKFSYLLLIINLLFVGGSLTTCKIPKTIEENYYKQSHPLKLWQIIHQDITYRRDTKSEHHWQPAQLTFVIKKGDCEDINGLLAMCLQAEGYEVRVVTGSIKPPDNKVDHAWVLIKYQGEKLYMDAVKDAPLSGNLWRNNWSIEAREDRGWVVHNYRDPN